MAREYLFSSYFSLFQLNMLRRQRILKEIFDKYKEDITFVFTTNKYFMEAIVPRKIWIPQFGYEVTKDMIESTTQVLPKSLVDDTQERFGTTAKKSLKVHMEHTKKTREKNVKKVIQE